MKNSEIKALSVEELNTTLASEQAQLQRFKFAHAISSIENPMKIRSTRKQVAKLATEISLRKSNNNNL